MFTVVGFTFDSETVKVVSAFPEKTLNLIANEEVSLRRVRFINELTFTADIKRKDMMLVSKLVNDDGGSLEIIGKHGLYWRLVSLMRRPVLLLSLIIFLILSFYLPTRILFIEISGNHLVRNERILEVVRCNGIQFCTARKSIRSEKIKNAILEEISELQWVGVNTRGCVAHISVKEKNYIIENEHKNVCSISAACDGRITQMTVTRGNPVVNVGDHVNKGDILVSGFTDCGISIKAEPAEAEIFAETIRNVVAITPARHTLSTENTSVSKKYSILAGKKLINFFKDSGISGVGCDRMYKRYALTLPGGFSLPLELICITEKYANTVLSDNPDTACYKWVQNYTREQLCNTMLAGKINSESLTEKVDDGYYILEGKYNCTEMIGQICNEELIQDYEQRD